MVEEKNITVVNDTCLPLCCYTYVNQVYVGTLNTKITCHPSSLDDEIKLHVLHSQTGVRGAPFDEEALAVVSVEAKNHKARKRIILKDYGDNLILEVLIAYAKIVRRKAKKGN